MASQRPEAAEPASAGPSPTVSSNEQLASSWQAEELLVPGDLRVTLVISTQLRVQWTHILSISVALGWRMISGADRMVSAWNRGAFPRIRELKACKFLSGGAQRTWDSGYETQQALTEGGSRPTGRSATHCKPPCVWGGTIAPVVYTYTPWSSLLGESNAYWWEIITNTDHPKVIPSSALPPGHAV